MNASQAHTATGVSRTTVGRWISAGKLTADDDGYFEEEDFNALNAERLKKPGPGRKTGRAVPPKRKATSLETNPKPTPTTKKKAKKKATTKKKSKKKAAKKVPPAKPEKPSEEELLNLSREHCKKVGSYTIVTVQRKFQIGYNRAQRIITTLKRELEDEGAQPSDIEKRIAQNAKSRQGVDLRKALANAEKAEMEVKIKMKDLISRELVARVFRKIYTIDSTEWRGLGPRIAPDIMAACKIEDPTKEVEISDLVERQVFRTLSHVQRVINTFLEEVESEERVTDEPEKKPTSTTKKKSKKKAAKKKTAAKKKAGDE